MADDIKVVVKVVGQQDIVKTTKSLKAMENGVKSLSKDLDAGRISGEQFKTGLKELRRNVDGSFPSWQKAKSSVDAYAKSVLQASNAAKQAKIDQEVAKVSASYDRLKASIDPVFAAQQRMKKAHAEIRAALKAEVITRNEAAASLRQYRTALKNGQVAGQALNKGMNRTGVLAQQAGYQFGDFAVQVQSGTNIMVAAGQQATQLVGTFSMLAKTTKMISLFAGLGVIIPVLTGIGAYLMRTAEASSEAEENIKTLESSLSSARSEVQGMVDDLKLLQSELKNPFELALSNAVDEAKVKLSEARKELERLNTARAAASFGAGLGGGGMFTGLLTGGLSNTVDDAEEAVRLSVIELATAKELSRQEVQRGRNASVVNQLHQVRQTLQREEREKQEELVALEQEVSEYARDHNWEKTQLQKTTQELLADAIKVYEQEKAIREEIGDAAAEALKLAGIDITSGVSDAAKAAAVLAANLSISLSAAQSMVNLQGTKTYGGRGSGAEWRGTGDYQSELGYKDIDTLIKELTPKTNLKLGGGTPFDQDAYLKALQKEADFKQDLVGMTEEQATEAERRREIMMKIQSEGQVADEARIKTILATEAATRGLIEAEEQRQSTMDMVTGHIESAFMSMVDGSKSVEDAFKGMLRAILLEIYQQQVAKPLAKTIGNFLFPNANGNAFSGGNVIPFANGGVVSSATMFPMAGNQTGVMGEAGPEAIMPLKRGANGKLGVQMEGGGQSVVVNQSFNFSANGDDSVKKIIAQAAPQIANMTKKSIMDDRRRGGQMKATFG